MQGSKHYALICIPQRLKTLEFFTICYSLEYCLLYSIIREHDLKDDAAYPEKA
jgi:hypothetical protein